MGERATGDVRPRLELPPPAARVVIAALAVASWAVVGAIGWGVWRVFYG